MPLPKRRFSRSRRDKRRTQLNLTAPTMRRCSQCGSTVLSHRVCSSCGAYRGRQVLPAKEKKAKGG
ncbi:MAG: 50S ribosomal protein L32 [Candidatus Omnitrophica bacterium]|nr:50S ribosomal protein L32 [Candidatus Omnitrophota bacterium]